MSISPSDLQWWGWVLCGLGATLVSVILYIGAEVASASDWKGAGYVSAVITGLAAVGCFLIGLIRFIKWAWAG